RRPTASSTHRRVDRTSGGRSLRLRVAREVDDPTRIAFFLSRQECTRRPTPRSRERLAHEIRAVFRERRFDRSVALDEQRNAIRHLEPCLLTRILHGTYELARDPLAAQIVVERRIEAGEIAALLGAREPLGRCALDEQICRLD